MAAVLDAVKPLVALLAQARDPQATVAQALENAGAGAPTPLIADIAAAVTDRTLARTTLTFAGVLDPDGNLTTVAPQRLAQAQVLLEVHTDQRQPQWDLVLTVPTFLRTSFTQLAACDPATTVWQTTPALLEVARSARRRLVIAAPFLHEDFVAVLAPAAKRVLASGGEVVILTRALSFSAPQRSSANVNAVAALRDVAAEAGRSLTVRSWEESGLGLHFKVLLADDSLAYLGSANLTPGGAAGHAEAGVLVQGSGVRGLAGWLDAVADEFARRRLPSG